MRRNNFVWVEVFGLLVVEDSSEVGTFVFAVGIWLFVFVIEEQLVFWQQ